MLDSLPVVNDFLIYPNPSKSGTIVISTLFGDNSDTHILIFDEFGRKMAPPQTHSVERGLIVFDFRGFRSGLYLFQITHRDQIWLRRVLIMNE